MSLPEAYVAHASMARLRLRIPSRRHDQAFFDRVCERLAARAEVVAAKANPATASLLIQHYCPLERLYSVAADENLFAVAGRKPAASEAGFANLDFDAARFAVPVLVGLAMLQAVRGNLLSPATSLLSLALAVGSRAAPGRADH